MAGSVVTLRKIKCHEISHERKKRMSESGYNMYDVIAKFSLVRENEQRSAVRWKN